MIIKYNRTSTINQKGERFKLDKDNYDLTINDFGVSGKIPFNKREGGYKLIELVKEGKVTKIVFEDLSRCGRTLKDSINTLDYFFENGVIIKVRNIGIESHTPNGEKNPMWNIVTSILSSSEGKLQYNLQDPNGGYDYITSVLHVDDKLYLGSLKETR